MSKPRSSHRVLEFKLGIVGRVLAAENVTALARELKLMRKDLYVWPEGTDRGAAEQPFADQGLLLVNRMDAMHLPASMAACVQIQPLATTFRNEDNMILNCQVVGLRLSHSSIGGDPFV